MDISEIVSQSVSTEQQKVFPIEKAKNRTFKFYYNKQTKYEISSKKFNKKPWRWTQD